MLSIETMLIETMLIAMMLVEIASLGYGVKKSESPNVHRIEHFLRDIRTSESINQIKEPIT